MTPSHQRILDISNGGGSSYERAMDARVRALASGIDMINDIGIGDAYFELLNDLVHPQPAGGAEGFVATVASTNTRRASA